MATRGWDFDLQRFGGANVPGQDGSAAGGDGGAGGGTSPDYLDFGGRRIAPGDAEGLRALHGDWQNAQRRMQQLQQELEATRQEAAALRAAQSGVPGDDGGQGDADVQRLNEELAAELMANPARVLERIRREAAAEAAAAVRAEYGPTVEQLHWDRAATSLAARYSDFHQLRDRMSAYLDQHPEYAARLTSPAQLEDLYFRVRAEVAPAPAAPDPNDPNFVQALLTDPRYESVRQQLRAGYIQDKTRQAQGIPPTLGNQPGGAPPAAPGDGPKTFRDAAQAAMRRLGLGAGR